MGRLSNIWWQAKLRLSTKLRLYNTFVVSVLLYGCETRMLQQSDERRLPCVLPETNPGNTLVWLCHQCCSSESHWRREHHFLDQRMTHGSVWLFAIRFRVNSTHNQLDTCRDDHMLKRRYRGELWSSVVCCWMTAECWFLEKGDMYVNERCLIDKQYQQTYKCRLPWAALWFSLPSEINNTTHLHYLQ